MRTGLGLVNAFMAHIDLRAMVWQCHAANPGIVAYKAAVLLSIIGRAGRAKCPNV